MDLEELAGIEPESLETEHAVYELFKWSVILKGLISLAEVLAALVLILVPERHIVALVQAAAAWLSAHLGAAPLAGHVIAELTAFSGGAVLFVAFFLFSRGLIKCFLIWALLRNILWAYPASLAVMGALVLYQLYEIFLTGSVFIIGITAFDLVVIYFIWREWRIVLRHSRERLRAPVFAASRGEEEKEREQEQRDT